MEVYSRITKAQINEVDQQIAELQDLIEGIATKTTELAKIKQTTDKPQLKLNYTLEERRFNYSSIKAADELQKTVPKIPKVSIDPNWLAANMQEPDIMSFYNKNECEVPFKPDKITDSKNLISESKSRPDFYADLMQNYADSVLDFN